MRGDARVLAKSAALVVWRRMATLVGACVLLTGCPKTTGDKVHVYYEQIANFKIYRLSEDSNDSHAAGGNDIYVMYRLMKATNTETKAVNITLDSKKFVTVTNDGVSTDEPSAANVLLPFDLFPPTQIPAGQTVQFNNNTPRCFIKLAKFNSLTPLSSGGPKVNLLYQHSSQWPPVVVHRVEKPSILAIGPALPDILHNACDGI